MWLKKLLDPSSFFTGMDEAERLMTGQITTGGGSMLFLDYFQHYCKQPPNCLAHLINTLAIAVHFLFYFSRPAHVKGLRAGKEREAWSPDEATAEKLRFVAGASGEPAFWCLLLLLAALLHDVGKTLAHQKTPFDSAQHGNKGYLLVFEALHRRPDPKNPGQPMPKTAELIDLEDFLEGNGFTGNESLKLQAALAAMILFHDRLGVWLTGESGVKPVHEVLGSLGSCAGYAALDYQQLAFILWVLTLADMAASIPTASFKGGADRHPLCSVVPGSTASAGILFEFLESKKGEEMRALLPALLSGNQGWFAREAAADLRLLRMIRSASSRNPAASALWNSTPGADDLALGIIRSFPEISSPDPGLQALFDAYGVWDYSLDVFGYPLYSSPAQRIIARVGAFDATFDQLVRTWVRLLLAYLIGLYNTRLPKNPTLNLEFKNHDDPLCYISPPFEII